MGIPIMLGSSTLKIVKYGFKYSNTEIFYLSIALILTFIVSMFVIKSLVNYLKDNDFRIFGWYRILLAILIVGYFLIK